MDNTLYSGWMNEVAQQCRFIRLAHSELRSGLLSFEPDRTFLFVHALIGHAAALAQLVWPNEADLQPHAEALRSSGNVADQSPLNREAARKAERSDASFREWVGRVGGGGFVESNIMPKGSLDGFKSDVFQRDLDPESLVFRFRDGQWDLDALTDEAVRIEKAVSRLQSSRRQV